MVEGPLHLTQKTTLKNKSVRASVFAIYHIMLGWNTDEYYCHETDELPNPRPTEPKKIRLKVSFGPRFPTTNVFRESGLILYLK